MSEFGGRRIEPLKVRVANEAQAALVLSHLYRLGCCRKDKGLRINGGGVITSVEGYKINREGVVFPALRGDKPGFDMISGREVHADQVMQAASIEDLCIEVGRGEVGNAWRGSPERGEQVEGRWRQQAAGDGGRAEAVRRAVPRQAERSDGLLPQLYELMMIAKHLGMTKAAQHIEHGGLQSGAVQGRLAERQGGRTDRRWQGR